MRKRARLPLLFALSLIATTTWSAASYAQTNSTKVTVAKVTEQHSVQQLNVPASVVALNDSELSFGVAGRLSSFDYEIGERVTKGTVVAALDKRQITASIQSLKAESDALQATLEDEKQQLAELESLAATDYAAQSELRRARAAVNVAEARLTEVNARLTKSASS